MMTSQQEGQDHGHNASPQKNVVENDDLALHKSHEHRHQHLHHGHLAQNPQDDTVYTEGTTFEPSMIPKQDPVDHDLHRRGISTKDAVGADHLKTSKDAYTTFDAEKGSLQSPDHTTSESDPRSHRFSNLYKRYRILVHVVVFLLFTGWWIASLILHRHDKNWIIPFLLWGAITLRLLFFHIPVSIVMRPVQWTWRNTISRAVSFIPENLRIPCGAIGAIAVVLVGSFVTEESLDNTRANRAVSLFGMAVFLFCLWLTSNNRSMIKWHTVIVGMLVQFIVALFVLRTKVGFDIFNFISFLARKLLGFAKNGVSFLTSDAVAALPYFFFSTLPSIIFFVSIVGLLFYWGILQWVIKKLAVFFFWSMRISGAEAVVAAATPFIGQGESAMLIKPFVAHLTMAEIHQVMTSGFATISGSILVAYIALGLNGTALISSCIMSIPASLAISKMRFPETEETLTSGRVIIPDDDEHRSANSLHAFANAAWLGLKIAGMILTTLLCIIGVVNLINALLTWWGGYLNINDPPLTLELIFGYLFYPVAFLLGVSRQSGDILKVARLIGVKVIQNEYVAYGMLVNKTSEYANMTDRSRLIATYALCGFGNIGSLGTQIGVLTQISPGRSGDVSRVAFSALISGILSTLTSASIAGLLVTDQRTYFST